MKAYVKAMEGFSTIIKVILALPGLDITWGLYRIFKSASKKNTLNVVLGVVLLLVGLPLVWLIDIISIVVVGRVLWID